MPEKASPQAVAAPAKVLIVDDDPVCLTAYKIILSEHFAVETASSGAEALARLAETSFAVVISDMDMPEMNGICLLSKVSEVAPATARFMLTGHGNLKTAMDAVNVSQVSGFFSKNTNPDSLINAVAKAIERYQSERSRPKAAAAKDVLSPEEVAFLTQT
jgi:DNA-binding NtrC family response regulator